MFYKNFKSIGDIGQNIVIGELSKYDIGISMPISDNYPFDLIIIINNKVYRTQIKTSSIIKQGKITFEFTTNNWNTGEKFSYSKKEVDICIGICLENNKVYIFDNFEEQRNITLRAEKAKNNNKKNINDAENYELSQKRIKELLNEEVSHVQEYIDDLKNQQEKNKKELICNNCQTIFYHHYKNTMFCSDECYRKSRKEYRKVERPSYKDLLEELANSNYLQMGKKYGVSDNAVRKWIKTYEKGLKNALSSK